MTLADLIDLASPRAIEALIRLVVQLDGRIARLEADGVEHEELHVEREALADELYCVRRVAWLGRLGRPRWRT